MVIGLFCAAGIFMFLNPAIPGVPVYITGGIILGNRFKKMCEDDVTEWELMDQPCSEITSEKGPFKTGSFSDGGIGYWYGIVLAVCAGCFLKFLAVALQQKAIGELLGGSLTIRQMVGVDQP